MAWNPPNEQKPSDKPQDQDPWTGRPKKTTGDNAGPPMLEDIFKNLYRKVSTKKFGKSGNTDPNTPDAPPRKPISNKTWALIAAIILIFFWIGAGIHFINANQQALVFRFGVYQKTLSQGVHWRPWGIDRVLVFDQQKSYEEIVETNVISQDDNIAHLSIKFNYHINDPKNYLLNNGTNTTLVKTLVAGAIQQTAATTNLDNLFTANKDSKFIQNLQQNIAALFNQNHLGLQLDQAAINSVGVPEQTKELFNQISSLYDEQTKQKQQALDYENQIIPPAQEKADQMIAAANAYASQAKLKAQEEVADFLAIFPLYQKNPALTRYRLYSQAMQDILNKTTKVVVDEKAGAAVYLPAQAQVATTAPSTSTAATTSTTANTMATNPTTSDTNSDSDTMYGNIKGGY